VESARERRIGRALPKNKSTTTMPTKRVALSRVSDGRSYYLFRVYIYIYNIIHPRVTRARVIIITILYARSRGRPYA